MFWWVNDDTVFVFGLIGLTFTSIIGSSKTDIFVEISSMLFTILRQPHLGFLILAGLLAGLVGFGANQLTL